MPIHAPTTMPTGDSDSITCGHSVTGSSVGVLPLKKKSKQIRKKTFQLNVLNIYQVALTVNRQM